MTNEKQQLVNDEIRDAISQAVSVQSDAINTLSNEETIEQIFRVALEIDEADGRVAFSGIGKSGDVAKKIVDTFNSIGVTSHFVHPVEALHGDLGALSSGDVMILISNSGNTDEMVELLKFIGHFDPTTVSITSNPDSELAQQSEYHINTKVTDEGAVVDLVPMASATVTMVVGDCLANALMAMQDFDRTQYGHFHPGGTIGKRLLLDVSDLLYTDIPRTKPSDTLAEVAVQMSKGSKGIAVIRDEQNIVQGILTDGDIRRLVEEGTDFNEVTAEEVMTTDPVVVSPEDSAIKALETIEDYDITQVVVTNSEDQFEGVVHLHDIMKEGLSS
ncbi:arabinose-5-phosphate isomerase [Halodesulfurarchaeum formicicum]|uniref:Arabinose-5-phosphate isomerase n=1 Tax=Halodesulfurarchaeum formicicum TaxID=1873524 RepID=A0A1D8S3V7_9EURY|nr:KpsF/GutQ family sugar-phosphate isomerase [Halodesulfurarchaeum formicicum]AOW80046.1 arabinose-5-phosphate isomerase [Halodesulfurarchaeum formicicum]